MKPPSPEEPDDMDDLDEEYRRASALDPSRPGEAVRRAVLDHAAKLAAERAVMQVGMSAKPRRLVASRARWRPAIFGSLAAAALAGFMVDPHFLGLEVPRKTALTGAQPQESSDRAAAAPQKPILNRAPPAENAPAAAQAPSGEFASTARQAPRAAQAPRTEQSSRADPALGPKQEPRALADQARVAEADSALKSNAGAARSAAAPAPGDSGPVDPAAAMRRAAEIGDAQELAALLDATHDVDARDGDGRTALMLATLHGQARAVDMLLAQGADPNAADTRGTTPLQAAAAADQQAIIRSLQRAGAR